LFSVNQTFEASVLELPNPFFAALGQCASMPGAPGASLLVVCPNKAVQLDNEIIDIRMGRNMTSDLVCVTQAVDLR
jgi:hypothetical protein